VLDSYRDDGPLAAALVRSVPPVLARGGIPLALAGALPLLVAVLLRAGVGARAVGLPVVGATLAWFLMATVLASAGPAGRGAWVLPLVVRATEYPFLVAAAVVAGGEAVSAAFALVAAVAYHHYDLVYRPAHQRSAPPRWVGLVAGGWELRMIAGYVLLVLDMVVPGYRVLAGVLAVLFLAESAASWVGHEPLPDRSVVGALPAAGGPGGGGA
jgi:hypothetical protein